MIVYDIIEKSQVFPSKYRVRDRDKSAQGQGCSYS